jgi:hypothetical protein
VKQEVEPIVSLATLTEIDEHDWWKVPIQELMEQWLQSRGTTRTDHRRVLQGGASMTEAPQKAPTFLKHQLFNTNGMDP